MIAGACIRGWLVGCGYRPFQRVAGMFGVRKGEGGLTFGRGWGILIGRVVTGSGIEVVITGLTRNPHGVFPR